MLERSALKDARYVPRGEGDRKVLNLPDFSRWISRIGNSRKKYIWVESDKFEAEINDVRRKYIDLVKEFLEEYTQEIERKTGWVPETDRMAPLSLGTYKGSLFWSMNL
jgi:hypothetical protein